MPPGPAALESSWRSPFIHWLGRGSAIVSAAQGDVVCSNDMDVRRNLIPKTGHADGAGRILACTMPRAKGLTRRLGPKRPLAPRGECGLRCRKKACPGGAGLGSKGCCRQACRHGIGLFAVAAEDAEQHQQVDE